MLHRLILICSLFGCLAACGGGSGAADPVITPVQPVGDGNNDADNDNNDGDPLDVALRPLLDAAGLVGDAAFNRTLPSIQEPLAQLGMKLFFSKSLGGDFDSACVSCHHPTLGGGDALSLPVGIGATDPDVLGVGRSHADTGVPNVPRNSPTVFNSGLWDGSMFWDSRVESFGKEPQANGAVSAIRTPDVPIGNVDPNAGPQLPAAQARFPVTSIEEMRGENFEVGSSNAAVRSHLAARIGAYGIGIGELPSNDWLAEFQTAFGSGDAETLITFDNIALALAAYQRSMVFTNNRFGQYVQGDLAALTDNEKQGAILFYSAPEDGGGGCVRCLSGDAFPDDLHHTVAFPQFGPGKGDGNDDDFGRARETALVDDRYRFRTPSLLNVAVTAPYGHAGAYDSLPQVLQHYNDPADSIDDFFNDGGACDVNQFAALAQCTALYPQAEVNSRLALAKLNQERTEVDPLFPNLNLNNNERAELVAFLGTLTDPCVTDRNCLTPWIADPNSPGPDGNQLNARDVDGNLL